MGGGATVGHAESSASIAAFLGGGLWNEPRLCRRATGGGGRQSEKGAMREETQATISIDSVSVLCRQVVPPAPLPLPPAAAPWS